MSRISTRTLLIAAIASITLFAVVTTVLIVLSQSTPMQPVPVIPR